MSSEETGKVDPFGLSPVCATCCVITSLYTDWPECIGCSLSGELLCFRNDIMCCKRGLGEDECCAFFKGATLCVSPSVCCKFQQQYCCTDSRAAFPCDPDYVPCLFTLCFATCFYKWGFTFQCCASLEDLEKEHQANNK